MATSTSTTNPADPVVGLWVRNLTASDRVEPKAREGGGHELERHRVVAVIAVTDMSRARAFYEGRLGLSGGVERPDGGIRYPCGGDTSIHVYPSPANASKSTATLAGFVVVDVERTVDELAAKGVEFERYDGGPVATDEKGIARIGDAVSAWVKDPDGNIVSVNQE